VLATAFLQNIRKIYGMNVAGLPGTVTDERSKKPIKSAFINVRQRSPKGCYVSLTAKTGVRVP
ncbi:MAG: hypothetical protein WBZ23_13265, partial [Pseudolabrys sp.]